MFIAVEGIDGCGKSTTVKEIARFLKSKGHDIMLTAEPTAMATGVLIRQFLKEERISPLLQHKLALMFAADRIEHLEKEVLPALSNGKTVITDRYLFSSVAYQSLSLPYDWVLDLNRFARLPDLLVFIDASVDIALSRITSRGAEKEIFEKREILENIKLNYDKVLSEFSGRLKLVKLNGELPADKIYGDVELKFKEFI